MSEHFGGYLPIKLDITKAVYYGERENVISVMADNSDDGSYPPGQSQKKLDFTYFGGIYRDVWLISMNKLHITDPNFVDKIAGGGLFVHFKDLSGKRVVVAAKTDIQNEFNVKKSGVLESVIKDKRGKQVAKSTTRFSLDPSQSIEVAQEMEILTPHLWSPQKPYLYELFSFVRNEENEIVDGFKTKIGVRKIEFLGREGFYLNNKPYEGKLIGANRHQDYGYVGNALPNSIHWRDAKKLKDAGCDVIRTAHYPQDPAFMDACDELGLLYIEAIPGWHFWSDDPVFAERSFEDLRQTVRRNRNRPSVLIWETVLNEAPYPMEYARNAVNTLKEEYPYAGCFSSCDYSREGAKYFDVLYSHTFLFDEMHQNYIENNDENQDKYRFDYSIYDKSFFVREFGDCVESFRYQNAPNRVHRSWGESAQIIQALHLASPDYIYTGYESILRSPRQQVGGCLWHAFDHQRGYSPDTFYGGIMDSFRQPKYAYYFFMSQRMPGTGIPGNKMEPMVYIAHEMTPFSPSDVVVFSNCDEVRLSLYGQEVGTLSTRRKKGLHAYPAIFKDAYRFYDVKARFRAGNEQEATMVAEGIMDGEVVVTSLKRPSLVSTKIELRADYSEHSLLANGSDFVTVIASITDDNGVMRRLNNKYIEFEVSGEGSLIGDGSIHANPRKVEWGTAPALVRSSTHPGKIKITARLDQDYFHTAESATLEIESIPPHFPLLYQEETDSNAVWDTRAQSGSRTGQMNTVGELQAKVKELERKLSKYDLRDIEKHQENIGGTKKN